MTVGVDFGFGCPRCGFSAAVLPGGADRCPECGTGLQPLSDSAGLPEIVSSFECPHCGHSVGMLLGFNGICPECHRSVQ